MVNSNQTRIQQLAYKWLYGTCTKDEEADLQEWYEERNGQPLSIPEEIAQDEKQLKELLFAHIKREIENEKIKRIHRRNKFAATAAALVLLFALPYYIFQQIKPNKTIGRLAQQETFHPGTKGAMLTLADGTKINLSDRTHSLLHQDGKVNIMTTSPGVAQYQFTGEKKSATEKSNTIETPIGTEYTIILSDGSKVWLNAGSTLTFPESFAIDNRTVKLSGEAYFEITPNKHQPFYVQTTQQTVRVYGTHFNVRAYPEENSKTTLIEGSVQVTHRGQSKMLEPGQAAYSANNKLTIEAVNIQEAIAWKNGFFYFESTPVKEALSAIRRWYNIDIVYKGTNEKRMLTGKIKRNSTAKQLIETLNFLDIKCQLKNNKIEVEL